MKKTNMLMLLICFSLLPIGLSGCWDKTEVRELGIVMGMGLDYAEGGQPIRLSMQTVKSTGNQSADSSQGSSEKSETLVIRGQSVYDAFINLQKTSHKKVIFPHSKLVVIGKQLAEKGMADISDFLIRERQIRPTSWLIVSETTASDLMESGVSLGSVPAAGIVTMLENLKDTSIASPVSLIHFYMDMQGDAQVSVAPMVRKEGNRIQFEKTAVFHKDKMIGNLTNTETRGLLWLKNKQIRDNITFPFDSNSSNGVKNNVSIEINKGFTRMEPLYTSPTDITYRITCKGIAQIHEAEMFNMVLFHPGKLEELEKAAEAALVKRIQQTIDKAQQELKADFLGFEDKFHNKYPKQWNELNGDWQQVFTKIKTDITVDLTVNRQGITKNPLQL